MGLATNLELDHFHVLAVDDSIIDRKLIETLLKTSSYQVTAVDSGTKALEFLGLNTIQEEEENEEVTNFPSFSSTTDHDDHDHDIMEESKSLRDIPVVIMSSENEPSRINRCLEDGAEEFFLKPVQLSDVKKLRSHLVKGIRSDHHIIENQPNIMEKTQSAVELEFQSL
ncbi:hypothetical protein F8388_023228 [Cannabis sativa]|uniref:Response regulatory domain-containing protein n=1 Tax=Cannabis sativa TaxID=3483 RepID=A0A7J6HDS9_CANSA|nr:hypothetical protein F8388_023228 [Cannabis sativa]KAF4396610.1 hypothetical protein G4B88_028924 [Cannabis sativa]